MRKGDREEEGEEDDAELLLRLLVCVPCDDVVEQNQMRKEETAIITKGVKRKRGHECDVCEKRFTQSSSLKAHMRIHTNEKPYECDVCEKRFSQSSSLKTHMRIHTNEKPYEWMCARSVLFTLYLKAHMRIHTNEKPYECDVCDEAFRQSCHLKIHMRIHTNENRMNGCVREAFSHLVFERPRAYSTLALLYSPGAHKPV